jgi:hypothetical protein
VATGFKRRRIKGKGCVGACQVCVVSRIESEGSIYMGCTACFIHFQHSFSLFSHNFRLSLLSLILSVVFSDRRTGGGARWPTVVGGGAAAIKPFSRFFHSFYFFLSSSFDFSPKILKLIV